MNKTRGIFFLVMILCTSFSVSAMDFFYAPDEVRKCKGCHRDVNSRDGSIFSYPQIRAQDEDYLYDQLINFKYGYKTSKIMQKVAKKYKDGQLKKLANYFSKKKNTSIRATKSVATKKGEEIYQYGIKGRIIACSKCHASDRGEASIKAPKLKYHHPMYIIRKLKKYRDLDLTRISVAQEALMHLVAKNMTDEEIESVAYYVNEKESIR